MEMEMTILEKIILNSSICGGFSIAMPDFRRVYTGMAQ
jgi:hypothetical protein